jgi:SAM-dependent methyltransferase
MIGYAREYVAARGLMGYAQAMRSDLFDNWYEWKLSVDTRPHVPPATHGHPDAVDFIPLPYAPLVEGLSRLPIGPHSHLLDYGAGSGRALVAAASLGVPRVTGVEIRSELASIARANVERARGTRATAFEVVCMDAADYEVPGDVDLAYFFKPFIGRTLASVLSRLESSLLLQPRTITVLYFNDEEFRALTRARPSVELIQEGVALPRTRWPLSWGIYRLTPPA